MILRALALLLLSGAAMAAPLMTGLIPRAQEASLLNGAEKRQVAALREKHKDASVDLFRANLDAMKGTEISIVVGGKTYHFRGTLRVTDTGDTWVGHDKPPVSYTMLTLGRAGSEIGGNVFIDGKPYIIRTEGRFVALISWP